MAWTTPITYTTGQVVTASQLNVNVRDNTNFLFGSHLVRVFHSTTQSLATMTQQGVYTGGTVLNFDSESRDTDTFHDTVTNNSRLTVPSGLAGDYLVGFCITYAGSGTGKRRQGVIEKNGTTAIASAFPGGATPDVNSTLRIVGITIAWSLVAGDYLRLWACSDATTGIANGGLEETHFWMARLGT